MPELQEEVRLKLEAAHLLLTLQGFILLLFNFNLLARDFNTK